MNKSIPVRLVLALASGSLLASPGCTEKGAPPGAPGTEQAGGSTVERREPAPRVEEVQDWDPSAGTASVTGSVRFAGNAPPRKRLTVDATSKCGAAHAESLFDESVIVNTGGTLKNVFVWVKHGLEGWRFPVPTESVVLDQKGCIFVPHVLGVRAGQPLLIRNHDAFLHNLHSYCRRNRSFNFGQPGAGTEDTATFRNPEVMVTLKCDLHPWMGCYLGVLPHPFFAVTGDDGRFTLENLPAGAYTIEAWHEVYGTKTRRVTLGENGSETVEFSFSP